MWSRPVMRDKDVHLHWTAGKRRFGKLSAYIEGPFLKGPRAAERSWIQDAFFKNSGLAIARHNAVNGFLQAALQVRPRFRFSRMYCLGPGWDGQWRSCGLFPAGIKVCPGGGNLNASRKRRHCKPDEQQVTGHPGAPSKTTFAHFARLVRECNAPLALLSEEGIGLEFG